MIFIGKPEYRLICNLIDTSAKWQIQFSCSHNLPSLSIKVLAELKGAKTERKTSYRYLLMLVHQCEIDVQRNTGMNHI